MKKELVLRRKALKSKTMVIPLPRRSVEWTKT